MFRKFVYITGALDYLVGFGTAGAGIAGGDPQQIPSMLTLGAFLCFAAATLMWASKDLNERASIVLWQGMVRATAVISTLVAIQMGIVDGMVAQYGADPAGITAGLLSVCVFDGVVATVYIVGSARLPGHSAIGLLLGKPATA